MTTHRKAYLKAYSRKYYEAHKDGIKARNAAWTKNNPDKRRAISRKYKRNNPLSLEANRKQNLKHLYGLSLDEYNRMFSEQNGLCVGCYRHQSQFAQTLAVDHSHSTGKVRGLLCTGCNTAIGLIKEKPETLFRLAEYLNKHISQ